MDIDLKNKFMVLFTKYFNDSLLPLTFFFTDKEAGAELLPPESHNCLIDALSLARAGKPLRLNAESVTCKGGNRYMGFSQELRPNFEQFLSDVERFKKTPELVRDMVKRSSSFKAPAKFIVFKRWDLLKAGDDPEVVFFFATADVISGLFTLANFDEGGSNGVFTPMGAGCSSVILNPILEGRSKHPRCIVGMFDITARPYVPKDVLTFAAPMGKFTTMVENMESSFLTTKTWRKVQERIGSGIRPSNLQNP
jgi:uncharacterized protein (DUF169 family)